MVMMLPQSTPHAAAPQHSALSSVCSVQQGQGVTTSTLPAFCILLQPEAGC
jgi:hypothetical protein